MPVYEFTAPEGSPTLARQAEIAQVVTRVHSEVTGAPTRYVRCAFHAAPRGSTFIEGEETDQPRMMGLIRAGRSEAVRADLIHGIADAWCAITGDARDKIAIFLYEVPGANCFEYGEIMPEASADAQPVGRAGGALRAERIDRVIADQTGRSADMALDLESAQLAGLA